MNSIMMWTDRTPGVYMVPIGKTLEKTLFHYERKEYAEAEKGADAIIADYPEFTRAIFIKAVILEETGRADEAEQYYRRAGTLFPLWLRLALQLKDVDAERSLKYFEKASVLDGGNNTVWLGIGTIHEKMGNHDKASQCFQKIDLRNEIIARLLSPVGFFILMVIGSVMMLRHGDTALALLVIASAVICLLWIKRDAGSVLQMIKKKKTYK